MNDLAERTGCRCAGAFIGTHGNIWLQWCNAEWVSDHDVLFCLNKPAARSSSFACRASDISVKLKFFAGALDSAGSRQLVCLNIKNTLK